MRFVHLLKVRKKKITKKKTRFLKNNPQVRGTVFRIYRITPRKPNSAIRTLAQIAIFNDILRRKIFAYIPGGNRTTRPVVQWNEVLYRGGRTQDIRGAHYKLVRGNRGCPGIREKLGSRSKYGTKSIEIALKKLVVKRRPFRTKKYTAR